MTWEVVALVVVALGVAALVFFELTPSQRKAVGGVVGVGLLVGAVARMLGRNTEPAGPPDNAADTLEPQPKPEHRETDAKIREMDKRISDAGTTDSPTARDIREWARRDD